MPLSDWFFTRSEAGAIALLALSLFAVSGCGSYPPLRSLSSEQQLSQSLQPLAGEFEHHILTGIGFSHRVISSSGFAERKSGEPVVVLFHGDGEPVDSRGRVRANPGPSRSLLLETARDIPFPWIMIGRPCYFAVEDNACHPALWTRDRYRQDMARSMESVLQSVTDDEDRFIFVAYSGGAVFAYELAARLPQVQSLLVLGGNMDVAQWVDAHGYSAMGENSMDPALLTPLPCRIKQLYLAGKEDANIHWQWLAGFAKSRQSTCDNVEFKVLSGVNHTAGWENWRRFLTF